MDLSNHVKIYLIRHAQSTANFYAQKILGDDNYIFGSNVNRLHEDQKFINAGLSPMGFQSVITQRESLLKKINDADILFCSPIKRSLQTCLLTYQSQQLNQNIYLLSLLTEFGDSLENNGVFIDVIQQDPDIISFDHSKKCDYTY